MERHGQSILRLASTLACALLLAAASAVQAGSVADADSDQVPDAFDNCELTSNGPADRSYQVDVDGDGNGDVCDCDFTGDGFVLGDDIRILYVWFNQCNPNFDVTGDGCGLGDDIANCFGRFNAPVGD